jgi:hypothetical protein
LEYCQIPFGSSGFHDECKEYVLDKNERWCSAESIRKKAWKNDPRKKYGVETIIEQGVINDYKYRDIVNAMYYKSLEESLSPWPERKMDTRYLLA